MNARQLLGKNILRLASRDGYSKAGLANYLDVPQQYVSRLIAGKTLPTQYIDKIAEYFEVPIRELFEDRDIPADQIEARPRNVKPEDAIKLVVESLGYEIKSGSLKKKNSKK